MIVRIVAAIIILAQPALVFGRMQDCSWDNPGNNRYTGSLSAAIDNFSSIPIENRTKLKERLKNRSEYDDLVVITKTEIKGKSRYDPALTNMHFGGNRLCRQVSRHGWKPGHTERGIVYCDKQYCVVLPTVCGNLAQITRISSTNGSSAGTSAGGSISGGSAMLQPISFSPIFEDKLSVPALVTTEIQQGVVTGDSAIAFLQYIPYIPISIYYIHPVCLPIPELPAWFLLLSGITAMLLMRVVYNKYSVRF